MKILKNIALIFLSWKIVAKQFYIFQSPYITFNIHQVCGTRCAAWWQRRTRSNTT